MEHESAAQRMPKSVARIDELQHDIEAGLDTVFSHLQFAEECEAFEATLASWICHCRQVGAPPDVIAAYEELAEEARKAGARCRAHRATGEWS
jgi:hypothetical protein